MIAKPYKLLCVLKVLTDDLQQQEKYSAFISKRSNKKAVQAIV